MAGQLETNILPSENSDPVAKIFAELLDIHACYDNKAGIARLNKPMSSVEKRDGQHAKAVTPTLLTLFMLLVYWRKCGWTLIRW